MTYTEAMAAVKTGHQAFRNVWPTTTFVTKSATGGDELVTAGNKKAVFNASADDKTATDWNTGKRP
jgi:hypothetical protein